MTLKILQNFYKATITTAIDAGALKLYLSTNPTPTSGYLVINPSNITKREIVSYSAVGTDGGGSYVTLVARGLGGTTDQAHDILEPVRMNITAAHYSEVQDEVTDLQDQIDTLVLQNAPNASTSVKGIVKLNTAPASATEPIALGSNDPRLIDLPSNFVNTSAGAADVGKGVKLNASGLLDETFIKDPVTTTYDLSGSPHTWTKPTGLKYVRVQAWGAGGSGGCFGNGTAGGNGGGGGSYDEVILRESQLGATVTVTVGTGGVGVVGGSTKNGNAGGNTTFGTFLTGFGGPGGTGSGVTAAAGGGWGTSTTAPTAGYEQGGGGGAESATAGTVGAASYFGGGGGGGRLTDGSGTSGAGGTSQYGGGGGGGGFGSGGTGGAGGVSIFGGNGGAGNGGANATAGTVPGGGGGGTGGTASESSGAGANGRCIVTEFYS